MRKGFENEFPFISKKRMSAVTTNSTRISKRFAELRVSGELGIVAYIVAGDPSLDASLKYVLALAEAGADVIELGVPFSDPLADGPTIQRGAERALKAGATLAGVLDLVRRIRWRRRRPRHGPHAGRIRRLSPHSRRASSRHRLSRRSHFYRRAPRENRRLLFRLPLSDFPHRRYRREGCLARRSPRAHPPHAQRHAAPYRRWFWNLASRPRFRSWRPRRRRRRRLRARLRD